MKDYFFRAKKNAAGGLCFRADYGYLYTVCHRGQALNFAICKTLCGWDITHVESGLKASHEFFRTRANALEYINNPINLDKIAELANTERAIFIARELSQRLRRSEHE